MVDCQYITTNNALEQLCQQYQQAPLLAVDTEFVRTRTFYPKLGLIQVYDGKTIGLIDTVAIEDLSAFWQLLSEPSIRKVLHACSEDLEVFANRGNCRPQNLVDSQIMMCFLGHGLSIGYAAMVEHFLARMIDKSESRTDWTKRPLSEAQLDYAKADVLYLFELYPTLEQQVIDAGWLDAAIQDSESLIDKKFSDVATETLYQEIKMSWKLNSKQLNNLKYLAQWRYQQACKKDLPLGFVVKEPTMVAVAQYQPQSVAKMAALPGVEAQDVRYRGKAMLQVLKQASHESPENYPKTIKRLDEYPGYKQTFKKVKNFVSKVAAQHKLTVENFASKKQINQFLRWHYFGENQSLVQSEHQAVNIDLLTGWRNHLIGEQLLLHAKSNFSDL